MKYERIYNRAKGTIETFAEDASRAGDIAGVDIDTMVAVVTSGNGASIQAQTYSSGDEALNYTMNFSAVGSAVVKVSTTYTGLSDVTISLYMFNTTNDGTGSIVGYQ